MITVRMDEGGAVTIDFSKCAGSERQLGFKIMELVHDWQMAAPRRSAMFKPQCCTYESKRMGGCELCADSEETKRIAARDPYTERPGWEFSF